MYGVSHIFEIWNSILSSCSGCRVVSADLNLNVEFLFFIIKKGQPKRDITLMELFCTFAVQMAIGSGSKSTVHFYSFPHVVGSIQYYFLFITDQFAFMYRGMKKKKADPLGSQWVNSVYAWVGE